MCNDGHHHHHHPHDGGALTDGGRQHETVRAVDSPVDKVYDNPRTFILEVAQRFFDNRENWEDLRDPLKRVIKGKEIPFKSKTENDRLEGSKAWGKSYVRPWKRMTQSMSLMERVLAPEAEDKVHAHQYEAMMYVLEGKGYEIHDGTEYTWEAGDLIVIHSGCVHSHYSADPDNPCRLLTFNSFPVYNYLHLMYQGTVRHTPGDAAKYPTWVPPWKHSVGREEYSKEDAETFARMREALEKEAEQAASETA